MPTIFNQNYRKSEHVNRRNVDYGKMIPLSFPFHELDLIDDMDRRANETHAQSRSQYVRRLIREDIRDNKTNHANTILQYT
tara:strand:+ start:41 stop:283 length:243 start_codon:yes stop_codon:yes gene_type:complete